MPGLSRKALILLLSLCGLIILLLSLETLFFTKDTIFFERFASELPQVDHSDYISAMLYTYLVSIFPVASVALYTFFLGPKLGTPPLYRMIWGLLIAGAGALRLPMTSLDNPLSILLLILYIALLLVVINIHRFEKEGEH